MEISSKIGILRSLIFLAVFFTLCASVLSQFRNFGRFPALRYPQRNKTYYRVKLDPQQAKRRGISPDNLFGWLNRKNGVRFYLWTRQNPELAHELRFNDIESIKTSKFDPRKLTKIIIHGWADGASEFQIGDWLIFMRNAYLRFADVNFIAVDYSVYASFYLYLTARPELVAERVAEMITFLEKNGMALDPLHVVGWSWGAHVSGMAGHRLKGRIGRITGIDPAGPTFKFVTNEFRLDKSDAKFVDIIHVNGVIDSLAIWGNYGLGLPLGHVDLYPNGNSVQTGCPITRLYVYETTWCSHGRGVKYFTESITNPLAFPACLCDTFDKYIRGGCRCSIEDTTYMGEHMSRTNTTPGIYHLVTKPKPLFGHGIPLNLSLSDNTNLDENSLDDTGTRNSMIAITYNGVTRRQELRNTYNSRSYPNDDILKISTEFVVNNIRADVTVVEDSTKSEANEEDNDVAERRTREINSTKLTV